MIWLAARCVVCITFGGVQITDDAQNFSISFRPIAIQPVVDPGGSCSAVHAGASGDALSGSGGAADLHHGSFCAVESEAGAKAL